MIAAASLIISLLMIILGYQNPKLVKGDWVFGTIVLCLAFMGVFMLYWGMSLFLTAMDEQQILKEARDRESKVEGSN